MKKDKKVKKGPVKTGKRKKRLRLPNEIIAIPNPDKLFHENWKAGRNMANIPHPFRGVLLGPPNVGKTTLVKNILLRADPPFEEVVVIHCDSEYTKEYDDVEAEILTEIPTPEDWEGEVKTLVILDDLEYKGMGKEQKRNLDRLFGYVSTHKNISCLLCSQDAFNVPPIVRRCSNVFILWKTPDMDSMSNISRKSGLKKDELSNIFKNVCKDIRDSLMIDLTPKTPYPLRKNIFINLKKNIDI